MIQYYTHNGAEPQGPFRMADLKERVLYQDTPIWYEGLSDWTTVGNVDNLQELLEKSAPPPFNVKQMTSPLEKERAMNIFIVVVVIVVIFGGLFVLDNVNYDKKNNNHTAVRHIEKD